MKTAIFLLVVLGLAGVGLAYFTGHMGSETPPEFRTAVVHRGDLVSTISATGTVEPVEVVDVGAQVVGRIRDLGIDPGELKGKKVSEIGPEERARMKRIDYGSIVHEGTELAYIDDSIYRAQLDQSMAAFHRAQADVLQFTAKVHQTKREWQRAHELHNLQIESMRGAPVKGISTAEYDLAQANYEVAEANLAVAKAAVEQAKASLELAQTNLNYTIIKSPVEGVIVDRRVNIGQTVVASLNAPSLFLIAKDLTRMQVWASVNEADIGRIRSRESMPVQFTVDAYPERVFRGTVRQVRLNATMTQNVVTYTVVVDFDNSDLALLPYLTANVSFEVEQRRAVLLAPNAALRWKPRPQLVAAEHRESASAQSRAQRGPSPGGDASEGPAARKPVPGAKETENRGRLWVRTDGGGLLRPIEVHVGQSDGSVTEVTGDEVKEGMEVAIGEIRNDAQGGDTTSPFAPKLFRGNSKQPKGAQ